MNGKDAINAPLFFQTDEDRLKAEIEARWLEARPRAAVNGETRQKPPQNAMAGHPTRGGRVLAILLDGQWHPTTEFLGPRIGGSEGMRRLRELRRKGFAIEARRRKDSAQWEYRLRLKKEEE